MQATVEVTSRSMEHAGKQQIIATVLWKCMLVTAYPAAADHSNSAVEAQASGSYPAAAADHSNSAMERRLEAAIQQQQIIATVLWKHRLVLSSSSSRQAADHSNSSMEAQASGSYLATVQAVVQKLY